MAFSDSRLDMGQVATARVMLKTPVRRDRMWPALVAATALALTSVLFAAVAVLAPPVETQHVVESAP